MYALIMSIKFRILKRILTMRASRFMSFKETLWVLFQVPTSGNPMGRLSSLVSSTSNASIAASLCVCKRGGAVRCVLDSPAAFVDVAVVAAATQVLHSRLAIAHRRAHYHRSQVVYMIRLWIAHIGLFNFKLNLLFYTHTFNERRHTHTHTGSIFPTLFRRSRVSQFSIRFFSPSHRGSSLPFITARVATTRSRFKLD